MQADEDGSMEMALRGCDLLEDTRHRTTDGRCFSALRIGTDIDRATPRIHDNDAITFLHPTPSSFKKTKR